MRRIIFIVLSIALGCYPVFSQESREELIDLYSEFTRCATMQAEDISSNNTQAAYIDQQQQTLKIIMVVEWENGTRWTTETSVDLADIDLQSITMVQPNAGISPTVEQGWQYGGIEFKTDAPRISVVEKRDGRTVNSDTWSAFIRIDDDQKRRCAFVALLAIVSQIQGIPNR